MGQHLLHSDNGPEFTAKAVRRWLERVGVRTLYIEPGSPWENGYCESFNGKLKDELIDREIFYSLREAQVLVEQRRREYNTVRPHSALGYRPPAPEAVRPAPWFLKSCRMPAYRFWVFVVDSSCSPSRSEPASGSGQQSIRK